MVKRLNFSTGVYLAAFISTILLIITLSTSLLSNQKQVILLYTTVFLAYTSIILYIGEKFNLFDVFKNRNLLWFFICITLAGNLFIYAYVTDHKNIQGWDVAGYWKGTLYFSQKINENLRSALFYLYDTINNDVYNALPCFFSSASLNAIGKEYVKYVITTYNLYVIPFYFVFFLLIAKVLKDNNLQIEYPLGHIIIAVFFFTPIAIPCIGGYLDAIGLLYIGILIIIIYEDALSKKDWLSMLLTIFLLLIMSFARRWYLFWVVAFFPSYFIAGIIKFVADKSYTRKNLTTLTINLAIIGIIYIGILYKFFNGFFQRSLFNNYSDVYSAYKWGGYIENLDRVIFYISIPIVLISIIGIYIGIKNKTSRPLSLMLLIQLIIIFFLFIRIQSFSLQHYYLISPTILYFLVLGIAPVSVISKLGSYISRALVLLLILAFLHTFINWPSVKPKEILSYLFPVTGFQVTNRSDIKKIEALVEYLNSLSNNNKNKNVYVLASSHLINDDILRNSNLPDDMNAMKGLCNNHCQVDKTHGFPQDLLAADIVVVADPIQYHLRPEDQRVVGIPAEEILSGKGIGKAYKFLKEFSIMNNVKLKVYEKIKPYSLGAIDSLLATFKSYYPDYPNLYSFNFYPAIIYDKQITDGYSEIVFFNNYHSIYVHPGDSAPTSFKIGLDGQFSKINLETSFKDPQQIEKSCAGKGGEVFLRVYIDGVLKLDSYRTFRDTVNFELPLNGAKELKIEVDKAKNNASCDGFEIDKLELIK